MSSAWPKRRDQRAAVCQRRVVVGLVDQTETHGLWIVGVRFPQVERPPDDMLRGETL